MESTSTLAAPGARAVTSASTQTSVRAVYGAAVVTGILISSCFLWFELFPLAWIAFTPLIWAIGHAANRRQAVRLGLVAGLVTNVPAFYWLVYTIHVFGGFSYPLAVFFYASLSLFTACQFVLFTLALHRTGPGFLALAAPLLWVSLEFWYPNLFPWRMGHCQLHVPVLMQIGEITGPYGLSFVMVWVAAALASALERPRRLAPLLLAVGAALVIIVYGVVRLPMVDAVLRAAPAVRVALVQGNVGIKQKGDIHYFDINLDTYERLSEPLQDEVDVLVWPETVSQHWVPTDVSHLEGKYNPFESLRGHLIFGGLAFHLIGKREAEEFNSAFLMGPDGQVLGRYDKRILMPFGEYIPFASSIKWVRDLSPQTGFYTAGQTISVFDIDGKVKIGQLICYEDLLASLSRDSVRGGAEVLLNILNDAWYGDSAAPHQHQALALWRAIENRRYLLRGSNTGVTSIIDPAGRVVAEAGVFREEVVTGTVHPLQVETFYTRFGDVFAWSAVAGALLLILVGRRTANLAA